MRKNSKSFSITKKNPNHTHVLRALSNSCSSLTVKVSFGGSEVKASAWNAGDRGSIPGSGRSPGEGNGNPLQYSCLENPMEGGAWWATPRGRKEVGTTERLSLTVKTWYNFYSFSELLLHYYHSHADYCHSVFQFQIHPFTYSENRSGIFKYFSLTSWHDVKLKQQRAQERHYRRKVLFCFLVLVPLLHKLLQHQASTWQGGQQHSSQKLPHTFFLGGFGMELAPPTNNLP